MSSTTLARPRLQSDFINGLFDGQAMAGSSSLPTTTDTLAVLARSLADAGVPDPRADVEWLLAAVLKTSRSGLFANPRRRLTPAQYERLRYFVQERRARVPLQHLLGETEFFSLPFYVGPDALIPRPETEILVETLVDRLDANTEPRILDVGTGAGPVAVALAHSLPGSRLVATDVSPRALRLAVRNACRNDVRQRIAFVCADLLAAFRSRAMFHAVVSNPPYVATGDLPNLQPEVRCFDPPLALDGGPDGLAFHRSIINQAPERLYEGGWLALEVADGTAPDVRELLAESSGFIHERTVPDLTGTERVLLARKRA
ncbi:MAG: peptide chain release factor N(5)-glutamine methyltransferase [Gemmatimonadota bacterium]|nr:peptide chain release factor N(5)-glutamine methyltransferase [Gemmatimonadota bacterium]